MANLAFQGTQSLTGTGTILMDGSSDSMIGGSGLSSIAAGIQILTAAQGGTLSASGSLTGQGLISAQTSGKTLTISAKITFVNQGTLRAINGGTLRIGNNWANNGTILMTDSTVTV